MARIERTVVAELRKRLGASPNLLQVVVGPRQVGKTTLCRQFMERFNPSQYLDWDVAADRAVLQRQSWSPRSKLLVMDEIHKMPDWKNWLKGVVDGRLTLPFEDGEGQRLVLVDDGGTGIVSPWERSPVPAEHQPAAAGKTTSATSAVAVSEMSCTTRQLSPSRSRRVRT